MTTWHEYIQKNNSIPEWAYPVRYGEENEITSDVLVIGGGVAGCRAAISAAKSGAKVVVAERGMVKRSGRGGAGVDHWHGALTNPCSKVTPEEYVEAILESTHGYSNGLVRYIIAKEGWDTLLECEEMGVQIRDVNDEFAGADFRDEKTKLMFAYDYENRHMLRIWGHNIKPCLYKAVKQHGVEIYDRIMVTNLLTEGGKQGARVIGATGFNTRTGEFYIFRSKASVIATGGGTGGPNRLFFFAPEFTGAATMSDFNNASTGEAIGWNAGAEFVLMEQTSSGSAAGFGYAPYSVANASNTWHGTPIVDANGKEVPWVNAFGEDIKTIKERFLPARGQKFMIGTGIGIYYNVDKFSMPKLTPDLPKRVLSGEFTLPLYADLTRLPELERNVIFGMMVGNEGKTRIPIYDTYTRAGFNPDEDLLQAPVMMPEAYRKSNFWSGIPVPHLRGSAAGGFLVDWDLRTSLEGLYATGGNPIFGSGCHGESHTTGRYAGRKAAAYAKTVTSLPVDRGQVKAEKASIYSHLKHNKGNIGWKELNYAIARVMQDYCGKYKNEFTLRSGLRLFKELEDNEAANAYASNPHELGRLMECYSLISTGELIMQASLARKASSVFLDFFRLDYPELDSPDWAKFLPIKLENNSVKVRELALDYHLKTPNAHKYEDNYRLHCGLYPESNKGTKT